MTDLTKHFDGIRARARAYAEHGTPGLAAPRDRQYLLAAIDAVLAECEATDTETNEPLQADLVARIRNVLEAKP